MTVNIDELKALGLNAAADKIQRKLDLKKKLTIAYEHYRFVSPQIVARFQEELKKKTYEIQEQDGKWKKGSESDLNRRILQNTRYDQLAFVRLADYGEVPPAEALGELKTAVDRGCFDTYEVAKIQSFQKVEDPIIFGRINGCEDRFFVCQWDKDVSITDILKENEG